MLNKDSKLYSIFNNRCPKCHQGAFFSSENPYQLSRFDKMEKSCSVCKTTYEPEPGFYYGAMYVSYGLNVVIFVSLWVAIEVLKTKELSTITYMIFLIIPNIILLPVIYRLARLIWANLFIPYDKTYSSTIAQNTK